MQKDVLKYMLKITLFLIVEEDKKRLRSNACVQVIE